MSAATPRRRFLFWRWCGGISMALGAAVFVLAPESSGLLVLLVRPDLYANNLSAFRDLAVKTIPAFMIAALVPLSWGAWMWRRASRVVAASADALLAPGAPPVVLYLRSFGSERFADTPGLSWEQQLVHVLGRIAPVVAVGRPGERLPQLGAARWQVDGAHWQDAVVQRLDCAALVVLRFGRGAGIGWETTAALQRVAPARLVLLVPARGRALERFAAVASPSIRTVLLQAPSLQPLPGTLLVLWFQPDGTPRLAGTGPARRDWLRAIARHPQFLFESQLNTALRPVFDALGVPWRHIGPAPLRVLLVLVPWIVLLTLWLLTTTWRDMFASG